jgi:cobalt-zinc-cadmium efflux system outer membrane protein
LSIHRWWPLAAASIGASALTLAAQIALAAPAPPFSELLQQTQATAPRLAEAQAAIGEAQGNAAQARARPNPSVAVEVENWGGSKQYQGFTTTETTARFEQPIELGGKRSARIAAGNAGVIAAQARAGLGGGDFAYDLAAAYAAAEAADLRLQLALDSVALAQEDARIAGALVKAGKEADLRAVQAASAVEAARAGVDAARAERADAFARLTALAGATELYTSIPVSLLVHADRIETPAAPDPMKSPAYRAAVAERDAAAARVTVERKRAAPDLTAGIGVRRFAAEDVTALVGGVSLPLPMFDRNRGNIAAAHAALSGAEARLAAARFDAQADVSSAISRADAALSRIASAQASERSAAEAYRLVRIGYSAGKLGQLDVLNARRMLLEARAQTINARLERLSAEAALARLGGVAPFGDL